VADLLEFFMSLFVVTVLWWLTLVWCEGQCCFWEDGRGKDIVKNICVLLEWTLKR